MSITTSIKLSYNFSRAQIRRTSANGTSFKIICDVRQPASKRTCIMVSWHNCDVMTDVVLTENELGKESVGGNNVAVISAGVDNVQISKSETARVRNISRDPVSRAPVL